MNSEKLRQKLDDLFADYSILEAENRNLRRDLETRKDTIEILQRDNGELKNTIVAKNITKNSGYVKELDQELDRVKQDFARYRQRLEADRHEVLTSHADQVTKLREEISRLKNRGDNYRAQYRGAKADLKKALRTHSALQAIFTRIDNIDGKLGRPHE